MLSETTKERWRSEAIQALARFHGSEQGYVESQLRILALIEDTAFHRPANETPGEIGKR